MISTKHITWYCVVLAILNTIRFGSAIRCFQCSSDENKKEDLCGAYEHFDTARHVAVDCQSEEANTPGIICVKMVEQGPRGFVWDGRWRTVIRRCASISETGVTGYCNWGHYENGVYWEECYCNEDECNRSTSQLPLSFVTFLIISLTSWLFVVATF